MVTVAIKNEGILQTCKACQHEFRAPAKLAGRSMPCPYCRKDMQIQAPAAAPAADRLVGREVGGCTLKKRLGAGALGVVYDAYQTTMQRAVAIKMLSSRAASEPETVARFQREAKLCAQLQHPNIVAVYDCGNERGVHFLVMELVEGCTFASLIEENTKLTWHDTIAYGMQIAQALSVMHAADIIHRDIKPANILITYDGQAKIADLGLAKQIDADAAMAGLTMQGVAMGSPAYMPPEQIRSARDATVRADIYALGASMFQAITGALPFDGRSATEVMGKVLRDPVPSVQALVPEVPAGVAELIERCLAKDAADRPQTAAELVAEMQAVLAAPEQRRYAAKPKAKAPTPSLAASGKSTARHAAAAGSNMWLVAALVLGIAIIGVFVWLVFK